MKYRSFPAGNRQLTRALAARANWSSWVKGTAEQLVELPLMMTTGGSLAKRPLAGPLAGCCAATIHASTSYYSEWCDSALVKAENWTQHIGRELSTITPPRQNIHGHLPQLINRQPVTGYQLSCFLARRRTSPHQLAWPFSLFSRFCIPPVASASRLSRCRVPVSRRQGC